MSRFNIQTLPHVHFIKVDSLIISEMLHNHDLFKTVFIFPLETVSECCAERESQLQGCITAIDACQCTNTKTSRDSKIVVEVYFKCFCKIIMSAGHYFIG